jgi:all-trans-retinol 13,14-reductase
MSISEFNRRDFIKSFLAGLSVTALDWSAFPTAGKADNNPNEYDVLIIGAGLGGLSCGAAFARQGFKPLVVEQHSKAGGYATTFKRKDFIFDVSLHSTGIGERNGLHNLIPGFPEITSVEFVPHPDLYRVIYPDHDIRVPQKNLRGYIDMLIGYFPEERAGIEGIFEDMQGVLNDIQKISQAQGRIDMSRFAQEFPYLAKSAGKTWGQLVDARLNNAKLKAIISSLWVYYGLPPARLSPYYYALPTLGYLQGGGYYPIGKSQKISDALVAFIEERGGKVRLSTRVTEILIKDHTAYGIRTEDGEEIKSRVVVSNASVPVTFRNMLHDNDYLKAYLNQMDTYSVSLSSFQIFLGLNKNLIGELGIKDTEIFYNTGYDPEADYQSMLQSRVENGGYAITIYDNLYKGYSPTGKNILNILTLQGYDHWLPYEADYFQGKKDAYREEKNRMADILIDQVEATLLPGLRSAIDVIEIGTPLTNVRYTGNYRGAIYGFDQTLGNSGQNRLGHKTPVKNLYLAGAWTRPGHGYGAVIPSGLECFAEIMQEWK